MLLRRLTILAVLAVASAAPSKRCSGSRPEPSLPVHGGGRELPAPPNGTRLKHVVLGHGYQNYTCAPAGDSGPAYTSKPTGALAVLYDVRPFFPSQSENSLALDAVFALAQEAAYSIPVPLNLADHPPGGRIPGSAAAVAVENPWIPLADLTLDGVGAPLRAVGHHFFDSEGVPEFDVGDDLFKARKVDDVSAPEGAPEGEDGSKAVAWLLMDDAGGSVGIKHVYRVNTVGGAGHACEGEGDDSSVYTAFYYMYG
ncbi:hypothetical protein VUR80DRAFT_2543 [Thermomyces stellatus]